MWLYPPAEPDRTGEVELHLRSIGHTSIVVIVAGLLALLGWARAEGGWPFAPAPQASSTA
jgi:hypothetical protein